MNITIYYMLATPSLQFFINVILFHLQLKKTKQISRLFTVLLGVAVASSCDDFRYTHLALRARVIDIAHDKRFIHLSYKSTFGQQQGNLPVQLDNRINRYQFIFACKLITAESGR